MEKLCVYTPGRVNPNNIFVWVGFFYKRGDLEETLTQKNSLSTSFFFDTHNFPSSMPIMYVVAKREILIGLAVYIFQA